MKDVRVEFKFKNAIIYRRLQEHFGEVSLRSMADAMRTPYAKLISLLNLSDSPFGCRGAEVNGIKYGRDAMTIANFFQCGDPADLFPVSLYQISLPKKYYREFESVKLLSMQEARKQGLLPPPESYEDDHDALGLKERVRSVLQTLTAREEKVLRMRFGLDDGVERTLGEVAEEWELSKQGIRMIEMKAFKRLRHPTRKAALMGEPVPEGCTMPKAEAARCRWPRVVRKAPKPVHVAGHPPKWGLNRLGRSPSVSEQIKSGDCRVVGPGPGGVVVEVGSGDRYLLRKCGDDKVVITPAAPDFRALIERESL